MKASPRRPLPLLLAVLTLTTLASCNRGMGCPTNLSVDDLVSGLFALFT